MLCKDRHRRKTEDGHVVMESDTGVTWLHTEECWGLPGPTEAREWAGPWDQLHFGLLTSGTERISVCFKWPVLCYFVTAGLGNQYRIQLSRQYASWKTSSHNLITDNQISKNKIFISWNSLCSSVALLKQCIFVSVWFVFIFLLNLMGKSSSFWSRQLKVGFSGSRGCVWYKLIREQWTCERQRRKQDWQSEKSNCQAWQSLDKSGESSVVSTAHRLCNQLTRSGPLSLCPPVTGSWFPRRGMQWGQAALCCWAHHAGMGIVWRGTALPQGWSVSPSPRGIWAVGSLLLSVVQM